MATRNITLVVVPGTGARSLTIDTSMTVANSINNFNESSQTYNIDKLTNKKKQYL